MRLRPAVVLAVVLLSAIPAPLATAGIAGSDVQDGSTFESAYAALLAALGSPQEGRPMPDLSALRLHVQQTLERVAPDCQLREVTALAASPMSPEVLPSLQAYLCEKYADTLGSATTSWAADLCRNWGGKSDASVVLLLWVIDTAAGPDIVRSVAVLDAAGTPIYDSLLADIPLCVEPLTPADSGAFGPMTPSVTGSIDPHDSDWMTTSFRAHGNLGSVTLVYVVELAIEAAPYVTPATNDGQLAGTLTVQCGRRDPSGIPPTGSPAVYFGSGGEVTKKDAPFTSTIALSEIMDHFHNGTYEMGFSDGDDYSLSLSFSVSVGPLGLSFSPSDSGAAIGLSAPDTTGRLIEIADCVYSDVLAGKFRGVFWHGGSLNFHDFIIRAGGDGSEKGTCTVNVPVQCAYTFWWWGVPFFQHVGYGGTLSATASYLRGHRVPAPQCTLTASASNLIVGETATLTLTVANPSEYVMVDNAEAVLDTGTLGNVLLLSGGSNPVVPIDSIQRSFSRQFEFQVVAQAVGVCTPQVSVSGGWGWPAQSPDIRFDVSCALDQPIVVASRLLDISISGAGEVDEYGTADYTCTARFQDGPSPGDVYTVDGTSETQWYVVDGGQYATISTGGHLNTSSTGGEDRQITIRAIYTQGGRMAMADKTLTINDFRDWVDVALSGPIDVPEQSVAHYRLEALFEDGSRADVTADAQWLENSDFASFTAPGQLSTSDVAGLDRQCQIQASYAVGSTTMSKQLAVTIRNVRQIIGLSIYPPYGLNEQSDRWYSCHAVFEDFQFMDVTCDPNTVWSVDSIYASVTNDGHLTAFSVDGQDRTVGLSVSYTYGGNTWNYTEEITIYNVFSLVSIEIAGPAALNERSVGEFSFTRDFDDRPDPVSHNDGAWSIEPKAYASISRGTLTAGDVAGQDRLCSVSVSYTWEGVTRTDTHEVTIRNMNDVERLEVSGPTNVPERSTADYTCTVFFEDGASIDVTSSALWAVECGYATIDGGLLTALDVGGQDRVCVVSVSYTHAGLESTASLTVMLTNVPDYSHVEILGPEVVEERSGTQLELLACFDDGMTFNVTELTSWTEWSMDCTEYAAISEDGYLTVGDVNGQDRSCTITASFDNIGDVRTGNLGIIIANVKDLDHVEMSGPSQVDEWGGGQFACTAYFDDGTSEDVTFSTSWSVDSDFASIFFNGYLIAEGTLRQDRGCTVAAAYTFAGVTGEDSAPLAIRTITPAVQAIEPFPSVGATDVPISTTFSWTDGGAGTRGNATSYDVFFGTNPSGELVGTSIGTAFDPGRLSADTTYYWRVDARNALGTAVGQVWSFTTSVGRQVPGDANLDCLVDPDDVLFVKARIGLNPLEGDNWQADLNDDGDINQGDLFIVMVNMGKGCMPTVLPERATACPPVSTACPVNPTSCPPGATWCPVSVTACPETVTICPTQTTVCPETPTECPAWPTNCPATDTECPANLTQCPSIHTWCPESDTTCPEAQTACPVVPTHCPDVVPTECPVVDTVCPAAAIATECPYVTTQCPASPEPTVCPTSTTACPASSTVCHEVDTECPIELTRCPSDPGVCAPTTYPNDITTCMLANTQCPQLATVCVAAPTMCMEVPTVCVWQTTQCEGSPTMCKVSPTNCPRGSPTSCSSIPTECPTSAQTLCAPSPTLCPQFPMTTVCPAIMTRCSSLETECAGQPTLCYPSSTMCPPEETLCPAQPTVCYQVSTICPVVNTICTLAETRCLTSPTVCTPQPTVCPPTVTWCPDFPTVCPAAETACPAAITECNLESTLCPALETACPTMATGCPGLPTACGPWYGETLCPDGSGGMWTLCPQKATFCPISAQCNPKTGDVNLDGRVNVLDLIKIRNNLGGDPHQNDVFGDLNGDGRINVLDLIQARNQMAQ